MPDPTVEFVQPISPTPGQRRRLHLLAERVRSAHLAVHTWLRHCAAGHEVSLLATARSVTSPQGPALPPLPPSDTPVRILRPTQRQVLHEFRTVRAALGWDHVPAHALDWAVTETLRTWRALGPGYHRLGDLPPPWSSERPVHLQLDNAAQPVDPVTLEIPALGDDRLVEADLFLLPSAYTQALWDRQRRRLAHESTRLKLLEHALYDQGSAEAARALLGLRARYAAAGIVLGGQVMPADPPPDAPRCRDRVVVREAGGRWEVVWSFQVPREATPRWTVDDILGIDPGQRRTWAYASSTLSGTVPRALALGWDLPPLSPADGVAPKDEQRALALIRHAAFERMRPGHEQLLALALRHRVCAVEAVQWSGFWWRHNYTQYAASSAIGIRAVLGWLAALAPLHGVQVVPTPAAFSSCTCARCGHVRARPGGGRQFTCSCGYREDPDINAARIHRHRALAMLAGGHRGR